MIKSALDILTEKLTILGMNQLEIDHLLARFLEEEAFDYVDYIKENTVNSPTQTTCSGNEAKLLS